MKNIFLIILISIIFTNLISAESQWETAFDLNLTTNLNTYTDNWVGEETGSFAWASHFNFVAFKQLTKIISMENTFKLGFGQSKMQDETTDQWSALQPSTDEIDFETLGLFTLKTFFSPFIAARVQTQFMNGEIENDLVSHLNPIILSESFGLSHKLIEKENQKLTTRVGGAFYQRINREVETIQDGGFEFVTKYTQNLRDDLLDYSGSLTLFQAVLSSEKDKNDKWKTTDVDWQNTLNINITKYLIVNFTMQLLFDKEVEENVRAKQFLSLGLVYKFDNKPKE